MGPAASDLRVHALILGVFATKQHGGVVLTAYSRFKRWYYQYIICYPATGVYTSANITRVLQHIRCVLVLAGVLIIPMGTRFLSLSLSFSMSELSIVSNKNVIGPHNRQQLCVAIP